MKKIQEVWTVVYKEKNMEPIAFTYTSEDDANQAKQMIEDSNGGEMVDESGNYSGTVELEWCYLINGKLIESIT